MLFLDMMFSRFRWYRWLRGGHWEHWRTILFIGDDLQGWNREEHCRVHKGKDIFTSVFECEDY
jgi:hypothetical protein